jgi:hypothetical protein
LRQARANRTLARRIDEVQDYVDRQAGEAVGQPVLFFNTSTRIHRLSLNGAFSLLASWAVRLAGSRVAYLVCQEGLDQCILGTVPDDPDAAPPCRPCMRFSDALFPNTHLVPLRPDAEIVARVQEEIATAGLPELTAWHNRDLPLGELCLPGLRWALRRHNLVDNAPTRAVYRRYLASAASLAARLEKIIQELSPRALVVFNGVFFPEAVARQVAIKHGVRVITHEVGLRPYSAFFTQGHATFRELDAGSLPSLDGAQQERLDAYLDDRRNGRFSMAGIRFWPEMRPIPEQLKSKMQRYRKTVAVFTNVVFDTSQLHANTLFPDMFGWLEVVVSAIESFPELLFVIRAHPDEDRPGKESRESVAQWYRNHRVRELPNVAFLGPSEYVDSYELAAASDLVLIYNSSIGLEASVMGKAVLAAGRARFTGVPTVYTVSDSEEYFAELEALLSQDRSSVPPEFAHNSRAFLHSELFHASLDLSEFLAPFPDAPGMVGFSEFDPARLGDSLALGRIVEGILDGAEFILEDTEDRQEPIHAD